VNQSSHKNHRACQLCGSTQALSNGALVRPALAELIRRETGSWNEQGWICHDDLQQLRSRYVESLLREDKGELNELEREVLGSLQQQEILAKNPQQHFDQQLTLGQRLADRIASFGGSWTFILLFGAIIVGWIGLNSLVLLRQPFDPYPYILLNLLLSCLAAMQAPIIMMSQNRQEYRDRAQAMHDYQVNLKAELEIRQLHQKLDHLLSHQWERLVAIQEIQMELIGEIRARK
jgi:uncharacterized membrane protein